MQHDGTTDIDTYVSHVHAAADAVRQHVDDIPSIGIILGTGLGRLAEAMEIEEAISYHDLPHFPVSTVESHDGRLLVGMLEGVRVMALQGRFHIYEGYSAKEVTFPVRVFAELGVETLAISNAAGGMNPHYRRGDVMLITDHINLQGVNPLVGPNHAEWGPRFPDMSAPYDPALQDLAREVALENGIKLQEGVYVAVVGPNLETPAEYRFLRAIGGDVVGMSTVPEVLVARHMGLDVVALSVITDECFPDALEPVTMEDVLEAAGEAEPKLTAIMRGVVRQIGTQVAA